MLYERWRQVAHDFRNEIALYDLASGERWTFAQLAGVAESGHAPDEPVVFPEGIGPQFIFSVLNAWRFKKIVCPLETGKILPTLRELPANCAHLKFISTSAGSQRMVAFRDEQLAADATNIVATMRLQNDAPNLGVISLAHSYGFSSLVLPLLLHGIPLALTNSALREMVHHAAEQLEKITLPAVPALWQRWLGANAIPKNVRLAISATAPLPLELEQEIFSQWGIKIHNFYVATECGGIAYDRSEKPRSDVRLMGEPLRNVLISENENGCLEVGGAAVGETYWPQPSEALANGQFVTSDLAVAREGNIYLLGRAGYQINVAGRKISPEFIEAALLGHPEVAESLVFGVPGEDLEHSEIIVACVAVNGRITGELLKQFLLTKLPAWKVPREWWFVDSLQASEPGNRSRADWRENYLRNKSAGETRFPTRI